MCNITTRSVTLHYLVVPPGLRVCPLSSIYWLVNLKLLIIEIEKRHNKMVDRILWDTVSYLPFYYVFFQFLLLTIFNLQANILTTKDILSNLGSTHATHETRKRQKARMQNFWYFMTAVRDTSFSFGLSTASNSFMRRPVSSWSAFWLTSATCEGQVGVRCY